MDQSLNYNYKIVKQFAVATVVWGIIGMLVGVIIAAQLAEAGAGRVRLMVQSNAGLPKLQGDTFVFDGTPEEMAAYAVEMRDLGFAVIGACCGSSPAHIAAMRAALA